MPRVVVEQVCDVLDREIGRRENVAHLRVVREGIQAVVYENAVFRRVATLDVIKGSSL